MSSSDATPPSPMANASVASETDSKGGTRRRQVVVTAATAAVEQRSKPLTGLSSPSGNKRPQANERDLGNPLRREPGLGASREQLMRGVVDPRGRPRRPVPKAGKPRWFTITSVLMKNAILLLLLIWLGMAIWRWKYHYVPSPGTPFAALDLANRVLEIEEMVKSLRKATRMTQVQVDVVDGRSKQTEERTVGLENDMSKLITRTDSLDRFLEELRDANFLTRNEFEAFDRKLKESLNAAGSGTGFGLDDISSYAREVVIKELEKHAADGIGRVDYALAAGGGKVLKHSEMYSAGKPVIWLPVKGGRGNVHVQAQKMLEPSFGEPGQCFALKGSSGFVEIKLRAGIIPDAITLEHVAKSVAYNRSSAPKDCRVWGWFEGAEDDPVSEYEKMTLLKEFSYDLNASNIQTFDIEMVPPSIVNTVRLEFDSNHGSPAHTCIYRFRVHGHEPNILLKDGGKV